MKKPGGLSGILDIMRNGWKEESVIKLLIYGMMLLLSVLFVVVLPLGHDLHFHLYRIGAMAEELGGLHFPYRSGYYRYLTIIMGMAFRHFMEIYYYISRPCW